MTSGSRKTWVGRVARTKSFDPEVAVATAMDVFLANGYAATTPRQLVDALGIGRGSPYKAFGSKHALFELRRAGDDAVRRRAGRRGFRARAGAGRARSGEHRRAPGPGGAVWSPTARSYWPAATAPSARSYAGRCAGRRPRSARSSRTGSAPANSTGPDPGALAMLLLATTNGIRVLGKAGGAARRPGRRTPAHAVDPLSRSRTGGGPHRARSRLSTTHRNGHLFRQVPEQRCRPSARFSMIPVGQRDEER